jgi:hypothetical protein
MKRFTVSEVAQIIEADRAGRIHLEPRDYTDATLAAALDAQDWTPERDRQRVMIETRIRNGWI